MELKDLAIEHDYYCEDKKLTYDQREEFYSWDQFYDEYNDADIDMNLIFRWDIFKNEKFINDYTLKLYVIRQRRGIFELITVRNIKNENVPLIIELLSRHKEKLDKIWKPL